MISPFYYRHKSNIKVHIFKTNIQSRGDITVLQTLLDTNPEILKWSIDMEDIDKVLRIEAKKELGEIEIIEQVTSKGFYCDVLE
ncbi:hypothetical protein [Hanstruepera marina]|uniref:hypothetical protein n=1 Tax=Hanstruepera marina TaxID=2873265 RepID=UPI001CA676C6|nr:hypothetical protein [Hanstruepera marina]